MRPKLVAAALSVGLIGSQAFADSVFLRVDKNVNPGEVRLSWTGGVPPYTVYRGGTASAASQAGSVVGTTSESVWLDNIPGNGYFIVTSVCTADPPAVCCLNDAGCLASEYCDASSSTCAPKKGPGASCGAPVQCQSGLCVDGVCCTSSCTGTCRSCDLQGSEGSCTIAPNGTDPDAECAGWSCAGYYFGFVGHTCYGKADVTDAAAACDGAGACRTQAQECGAAPQGPGTLTCDTLCQDPTPGTCTGTTPGLCTNVNPGNQTCGQGICQRTVPQCVNGAPNACTPGGPPTSETCNGLDDNCDGLVDNNPAFVDGYEPNDSCAAPRLLPNVSDVSGTITVNSANIYPAADVDVYQISALEMGSSCACCDGIFCLHEDFRMSVSLTVPAGAGSYEVCLLPGPTCTSNMTNCTTVAAGSSGSVSTVLHGSCLGIDDAVYFVRVRGNPSVSFSCSPYTLRYSNTEGCFP